MRPLSAADAVTPAWNHTTALLPPRNWRLLLKIGAVAVFAQIGGISLNSSSSNNHGRMPNLGTHAGFLDHPGAWMAAIAAAAVLIITIFLIVELVLFYLSSRLQFVLFEVVLRRDTHVAPIWNRYGPATWRWMGLRFLLLLVALVFLSPVMVPAVIHLIHGMPNAATPPADVAAFFATFIGLFAMAFLVVFVFSLINILLHDFGLPFMALESTPMNVTIMRVVHIAQAEPGQVALYLLLRALLQVVGKVVVAIAIVVLLLVLLIPAGLVALILWAVLHHAGTAGYVIMGIGIALDALLYLAVVIGAAIAAAGYVDTFLQAYALYFLGGRYPLVGDQLEPLLPATPTYPAYAVPAPPPATL